MGGCSVYPYIPPSVAPGGGSSPTLPGGGSQLCLTKSLRLKVKRLGRCLRGIMWVSRIVRRAAAPATTTGPPGLSPAWHREQVSNNHLLNECSKWDDMSKVLLFPAQQARCYYHYYWSKSIIRISAPTEFPVLDIPSQTLPSWFTGYFELYICLLLLLPSADSDAGLVVWRARSPILWALEWFWLFLGSVPSPPRWGEVFISMQLGSFMFGVSHSVPKDTALSSSEMCPLKGQARNTQVTLSSQKSLTCVF